MIKTHHHLDTIKPYNRACSQAFLRFWHMGMSIQRARWCADDLMDGYVVVCDTSPCICVHGSFHPEKSFQSARKLLDF